MVKKMLWEGPAMDMDKRHTEMDVMVYSIKKKSRNYDTFLKQVQQHMIVSDPRTFKICYWDNPFERELRDRVQTFFKGERLEALNENFNTL